MAGWVILIPFVLLGIFLRTRWLVATSVLVLVINGLVLLSTGVQSAGSGTYLGWAALGVLVISIFALLVMWVSAGSTWMIRKCIVKKP